MPNVTDQFIFLDWQINRQKVVGHCQKWQESMAVQNCADLTPLSVRPIGSEAVIEGLLLVWVCNFHGRCFSKEVQLQEREKLQLLVSAFSNAQQDQYEIYWRSTFPKASMRKLMQNVCGGDRPAECSHCHGWHHQGEETEHVPCVDKICWEEGKEGDSFFVNFCDENFIWISCNWKKIKLSRGS